MGVAAHWSSEEPQGLVAAGVCLGLEVEDVPQPESMGHLFCIPVLSKDRDPRLWAPQLCPLLPTANHHLAKAVTPAPTEGTILPTS